MHSQLPSSHHVIDFFGMRYASHKSAIGSRKGAGRRHDFRLAEAEDCSLLHPVDGQS
jgi:hypothetical protein